MADTVAVCNRCGSPWCWTSGKDICTRDGLAREVAHVPAVKLARHAVMAARGPKKK